MFERSQIITGTFLVQGFRSQSLDHPYIIRYLDSFIENNELYIAVEWAEKGDLKRIIRQAINDDTPLQENKVWEYVFQMSSALQHMHDKRIMHRDLKPANIFIGADGILKLGDLGLGRHLSSQTFEAYSRVGTPLYMSPEVLQGNGYDWKSDVWSLGCIAYELCMLKSPFKKEDQKMSLYDLFQSINKGEFPPIEDKYAQELRFLIESMLKVNPGERLEIKQICDVCELQKQMQAKRPKIDPYLIMDDIIEKLRLLDYENGFCKVRKYQPISRIYFAHNQPEYNNKEKSKDIKVEKVHYFYELSYWLLSLSKSKKLGPYVPFKKNKVDSHIEKVLKDLKVFGIKIPEAFDTNQLKEGYGESVCFIINDLLNRELIRRDFKFLEPVVKDDDDQCAQQSEDSNDESDRVISKQTSLKRKNKQDQNVMTRQEFFPKQMNLFGDSQVDFEKTEWGMMEPHVDPEEWMEEFRRVKKHLSPTKEEIKQMKNAMDPTQEANQRIHQVILNMKRIGEFSETNAVYVFNKATDEWEQQLQKISKNENKINQENNIDINKLNTIVNSKKEMTSSLYLLRDSVKEKIDSFDIITEKCEEVYVSKQQQEKVELMEEGLTSDKQVRKVKLAITDIKKQIKKMDSSIGIVSSVVFSNTSCVRQTQNHLYDWIEQ